MTTLSVIIVCWNERHYLGPCLAALAPPAGTPFQEFD